MSMIMDSYGEYWQRKFDEYNSKPYTEPSLPPIPRQPPIITPTELELFKIQLEKAKIYDKKNGEPDCELEEKKKKLLLLARELGVEITFL